MIDPGAIEFDQGTGGFGSFNRHVYDQPRRSFVVVEQMVDLVSQLEEAAVVAGHSRVRQGKLRSTVP